MNSEVQKIEPESDNSLLGRFVEIISTNWVPIALLALLSFAASAINLIANRNLFDIFEQIGGYSDPNAMYQYILSNTSSYNLSFFPLVLVGTITTAGVFIVALNHLNKMEEPLLPAIIRTSLIFFITYLIWIFTLMFGLMLLLIPGLIILFGTLYIPMRCADQKKWGWGAIFSAVKLALKNPLKTFICWLIVFVVLFCTSFIQGLSNLVLPWEVASVFSSALTICAYTATIIFCTVIYDDIK